jgi:hypothetical protein
MSEHLCLTCAHADWRPGKISWCGWTLPYIPRSAVFYWDNGEPSGAGWTIEREPATPIRHCETYKPK